MKPTILRELALDALMMAVWRSAPSDSASATAELKVSVLTCLPETGLNGIKSVRSDKDAAGFGQHGGLWHHAQDACTEHFHPPALARRIYGYWLIHLH